MRRVSTMVLVGALIAMLPACAKRSAEPVHEASHYPPPPASSPLSKVQIGMSEGEVQNLLGVPTDQNAYVTGKAFVPFYYGRDRHRLAYFYKGMGRVVFAGGGGFSRTGKVSRVEYDPSEPGHAR